MSFPYHRNNDKLCC